eukprot:TRINITY_DN280_c0_g1_i5.p1 TRINITY_DN280_c0_g1~~TRINITY_DN280_c0_g1_i5.p1  ORF type:complete len:175 (+),score=13.61 TRINITY_DN280_c0_g1_i5:159-683(+)
MLVYLHCDSVDLIAAIFSVPHTRYRQMRILITGGAGFIGSHIVDACLAAGHDVYVVDNLSTGSRENLPESVPVFVADICDNARVSAVFDEVQPNVVCHQAAQISVSRSVREPIFDTQVNILGTLNVCTNAMRIGCRRIVFASSGGVLYGDILTPEIGRAVQQECRDRSRMPSSA